MGRAAGAPDVRRKRPAAAGSCARQPLRQIMNITDFIREQARSKPDAPAIVRTGLRNMRAMRTTSYADLDRTIDAIARRVLDLGLVPGDIVGLALDKTAEVGRTYAVLAMSLGTARAGITAKLMSDAGAPVVLCFVTTDTSQFPGVKTVLVDAGWFQAPTPDEAAPVPSHQDGSVICRIFPTSGTTGQQKEVAFSHDLMVARVRFKNRTAPLPAEPVLVAQLGAEGAYGFRDILRVLAVGGSVALVRTPEQVIAAIDLLRANVVVVAPGTVAALIEALPQGWGPFPWIESLEVGGAELPARPFESARTRLTPNIRASYGSTEAGSVADAPAEKLAGRPGAAGYVLAGIEVQAVDENDQPVPAGTEGVLRVRSEYCVDSYVNDPAATALAFRHGWFYPGDLGSVTSDGLLVVSGRAIELINHGGSKVSPRVIEEALLAVPGVTDAAAFGAPDDSGVTTICAAIVADDSLDRRALRSTCMGLGNSTPQRIVRVRALPRNANGKIIRGDLAKLLEAQRRVEFDL